MPRPNMGERCRVLFTGHEVYSFGKVPHGSCRTALEVLDAWDRRFAPTAICPQDECPPKTRVVRGWGCRLTYFFDDVFTTTCRREDGVISFGGGG